MTPMETFHNDYKEHTGQEKLKLDPTLNNQFIKLNTLQIRFCRTLPRVMYHYPTYFAPFTSHLYNILADDNYDDSPYEHGNNEEAEEDSSKMSYEEASAIDGAKFIYDMNIYTQLYYLEKFYMNNLPKEIEIEYICYRPKLLDIFKSFVKTLKLVFSYSSYNPKYSKFDTFGQDKLTKGKQIKVLDKPVTK